MTYTSEFCKFGAADKILDHMVILRINSVSVFL